MTQHIVITCFDCGEVLANFLVEFRKTGENRGIIDGQCVYFPVKPHTCKKTKPSTAKTLKS